MTIDEWGQTLHEDMHNLIATSWRAAPDSGNALRTILSVLIVELCVAGALHVCREAGAPPGDLSCLPPTLYDEATEALLTAVRRHVHPHGMAWRPDRSGTA